MPPQRVWRQLVTEADAPRDHDAVLRIALASMAADPTSALTQEQRVWIIDLAHRTTRFTAAERVRLKTPLMLWIEAKMPRCVPLIAKQFRQKED
jgi:hypothetical protein